MAFEDFGIQMEEDPLEKEDYEQPSSGRQAKIYLKSMFHGYYEVPHTRAGDSAIQEFEGSTLEEKVKGGYEESPGNLRRDKATPFSGVVKFFSNMTDVAHKWRALSQEEPQIGHHRETFSVGRRKGFILESPSSGASSLHLPCRPSETVLWGSAIGRCQCHHPKALQATCSFEMSIEGEKMPGQALAGPCTIVDLASTTSTVLEFQDDPMPQN